MKNDPTRVIIIIMPRNALSREHLLLHLVRLSVYNPTTRVFAEAIGLAGGGRTKGKAGRRRKKGCQKYGAGARVAAPRLETYFGIAATNS